jgi:hypothetical protein
MWPDRGENHPFFSPDLESGPGRSRLPLESFGKSSRFPILFSGKRGGDKSRAPRHARVDRPSELCAFEVGQNFRVR